MAKMAPLRPSPAAAHQPAHVLRLAEFPSWFESKLSDNLIFELHDIADLLDKIRSDVSDMQSISNTLRDLYANVTATPQIARILKLCDQIDAIASLYGHETPKLPGSSYLADLTQKLRNRMKTVDDMASSSKIVRTDPVVASSLSSLRAIIHAIVSTIESLETAQRRRAVITDYIDYIHLNVLDPIISLVQQNSRLSANQDTQQILSAAKDVSDAEAEYKQAFMGEIFIKMLTFKRERQALQAALDDMLVPIRNVVKDSNVAATFLRMEGISWHRNLVNMLSCPTTEMLQHCRYRYDAAI